MSPEAGGLTEQPGPEVEDPTVTHPGVTVEGDGVQGGQIVQEAIGEVGEKVVVEVDFGGPSRET